MLVLVWVHQVKGGTKGILMLITSQISQKFENIRRNLQKLMDEL